MPEQPRGIQCVSLIEGVGKEQFYETVNQSISVFKGYPFEDCIEAIIFYRSRKVFAAYLWETYRIEDNHSLEGKSVHYAYGEKSVIGAEEVRWLTSTQLIHELGHAVETHKLLNMGAEGKNLKKRDGYKTWEEFFCQAHASLIRKEIPALDDLYMGYFLEMLDKKERRFNEENIDRTFLHMVFSMSELYYYKKIDDAMKQLDYMDKLERETTPEFARLYQKMYEELLSYMERNGKYYEISHELYFFDVLELYKKRFTNFFSR